MKKTVLLGIMAVLAGLLLTAPARAEQGCVQVQNGTDYMVFGSIMTSDNHMGSFRLSKQKTGPVCVDGVLYPGPQVEFQIKSFLGVQVFNCKVNVGDTVVITAERGADKVFRWFATCAE